MDLQELLKRLRERKSCDTFGYGLTTADRYVEQIVKSIGVDRVSEYLGDTNLDTLLKEAGERVVYANPESSIDRIATSVDDMKAILPKDMDPPKGTLMVIKHTLTTPREDRDGDVLETSGAAVDPKLPLLWQHMHTLPIGRRVVTLMHNAKKLQLASALLDMNALTADAAKLIEADVLRFSHGFRTLDWEERYDKQGNWVGFHITKFEIMEASLVSVPSNVDAVIDLYSRDKLHSPIVKSAAKALFDARQVQVPGVELEDEKHAENTPEDVETEPTKETADPVPAVAEVDEQKDLDGQEPPVVVEETTKDVEPEVPGDVTEPEEVKAEPETKQGREISAANLVTLKECVDDLREFLDSDTFSSAKRSEQLMLQRCYDNLKQLVDRVASDDEASAEPADTKESEEITVGEAARRTLEYCDMVFASREENWKRRTLEALACRMQVERDNQKGELFKQLRSAAS